MNKGDYKKSNLEFNPSGDKVPRLKMSLFSDLSLAWSLPFEGNAPVTEKSVILQGEGALKWEATGYPLKFNLIERKCSVMRSASLRLVSPTYKMPQRLQAMT